MSTSPDRPTDAELHATLGLELGVTEAEVIKAYFSLPDDERKAAERAYLTLRNRFSGKEDPPPESGTTAADRARSAESDGGPSLAHLELFGLSLEGCTRQKVSVAHRLAVKTLDSADHAKRRELDEAQAHLLSYFQRQKESAIPVRRVERDKSADRLLLEQIAADNPVVVKHLALLGLEPGAVPKAITYAYQQQLRRHSATGGDAEWAGAAKDVKANKVRDLREAHDALQAIYFQYLRKRRGELPSKARGRMLAAAVAAIPVLAFLLLSSFLPELKASMTHFDDGQRVYMTEGGTYFGTVVRYEPAHVFKITPGFSVGAYQVQAAESDEPVWVSEWFATRALYADD